MTAAANPTPKTRTWRQRLVRWFLVGLTGYLGTIVVLMLLENWLLYQPTGPDDWLSAPNGVIEDVELTSAAGDKIHGWWYPREGATGAILYFHGNAGNLSWRGTSMCLMVQELNQPVLIVDYPGYGKSSGRPTEAGCYAAADAAYDWLTNTQEIAGENILIYGASLGGGVAVDLASRRPHRALILVKTFTSAPDVGQSIYPFLPVRWVMRNQFNSLSKLNQCNQPIFIAHGDADRLIPFKQGQRLFEAASGTKQFMRLPGAGHNDPLPPEFFTVLNQFLTESALLPAAARN
jgi:uncharacterized protein